MRVIISITTSFVLYNQKTQRNSLKQFVESLASSWCKLLLITNMPAESLL